jgi:peptidyl-prolyl cis-trans isomerase C
VGDFPEGVLFSLAGENTLKKLTVSLITVCLTASLISCAGKREANRETDPDAKVKILATVNGVPITEYDVKQIVKRFDHEGKMNPEADQNVLETLVRNELIYQQSIELGLDKNPGYRRKLHQVEAQLRAFQREEMKNLYRGYIRNKAEVPDTEAQQYFEKNSKRMQTKYHIWQIYSRDGGTQIAEAEKDLKRGMPFEKVASKRFPKLPKGMKAPWDLGYLHWNQIPPPWQDIVDRLEPGQVSDVIKGPNERFWIIKLVDKSVDPNITFATEKGNIVEALRKKKADELYDAMLGRMREKSKIIFPKPAEGAG